MPASIILDGPEANIGGDSLVKITLGASREYTVAKQLFTGDFCNLYSCSIPITSSGTAAHTWYDRILEDEGSTTQQGLLKIVRDEKDNDLVENEARILGQLFPKTEEDVKFYRYLPRLVDFFKLPSGKASVILPYFGDFVSLADILKAYPRGIDFRDMVWMFKRILVGIGFAHKNSVAHGAVLPTHVLVHPTDHGAKILDWSFSVGAGGHISGISGGYRAFYPPEVLDKERARPATDIYMAAKCAVRLLGGDVETNAIPDMVPKGIRDFFEVCLAKNPTRRPQDAWDLHVEFDQLLVKLVGKPTYRPFVMP